MYMNLKSIINYFFLRRSGILLIKRTIFRILSCLSVNNVRHNNALKQRQLNLYHRKKQ